ncbi:mandelate racemase/muconate lactonizing enzyme family protein [Microbacterium sp. ASV49]|uniref:Mandelate racemase/muconate lactonizing enzyme family protein n=1 Tax=Microbacterium candidum TaxID=3041922 RepID=A0ABT7MWB9_9MICO|nr:mandelate racemase/muconate lactonizing enzyme family protein [Microbacterium sp. ASV49]MDL9978740.1 mandelate racemase/muconate lactonizing enzyme family protein [Microbacterium sp. ASV49]
MKIAQIVTTVVGTPWRELTFVELLTDDGRVGVGEVRMVNKTETLLAAIRELGDRYVIGSDPFDLERIAWGVLWKEYGRAGEVAQSALAAIDIACWDLIGQACGQPVWRLMGGRFRDVVPAYANGWYQGDRDPESIAALARNVSDRGYRALKLDPFGAATADLTASELARSVRIVDAVRGAVGDDTQIMIEMHGRFRSSTAIRVADALEHLSPTWIEEPVPPGNIHGLRNVRRSTPIPIATGERVHELEELAPLLEEGLVDTLQVDMTHFGGLTGIRRVSSWAAAYNVPLAPHNVCGPVGTAANVHFGVATPNYQILEHFNDFADSWVLDLVDGAMTVDAASGGFTVPDRPGLGVRLDRELAAEHPSNGATFNLFAVGWERREGTALTAATAD